SQICGRPRSHPQSDQRARLDRQLSQRLWLAARPAGGRGPGKFGGAAEMESIAGIYQDDRLFRPAARPRVRTPRSPAEPALQKNAQPRPARKIVHRAIGQMRMPRSCSWHFQAVVSAHNPAVHHRVRDFGMKLQGEGAADTDRLHFENVAFGEKLGAVGQVETLAVPLVDAFRPGLDDCESCGCRPHRVITDLGMAAWVAKHFAAEKFGANLRAETDAKE